MEPKPLNCSDVEDPAGMDEMEFTEAESNMNDLVSEYQQYQARPRRISDPKCWVQPGWTLHCFPVVLALHGFSSYSQEPDFSMLHGSQKQPDDLFWGRMNPPAFSRQRHRLRAIRTACFASPSPKS